MRCIPHEAMVLLLLFVRLSMGDGRAQAGAIFSASTGGDVHGYVGANATGINPVSVSGSGSNSGTALGEAAALRGSAGAFAQKVEPSGGNISAMVRSLATFRIDDLIFSHDSGASFASGTSFSTSLNYGLSGGIDLSGMNTTAGVNIKLIISAFNVDVAHSGSFSALHSLHDYASVSEGEWVVSRSGSLSSFATGSGELQALYGASAAPVLTARDELFLTSSAFTLTADANGVIASPTVTLILEVGVGGPRFRGNSSSATSDFMHGFSFAKTGPVFNLPEGITVNSADGMIENNRWAVVSESSPVPEPSSVVLFGMGVMCVALRRGWRTTG